MHTVSREMASDAGEPDMQGQEIPEWGHCSRCHGAGVVTADAPPEVTEEMVEAAMEEAKGWGYPRRWAWHEPGCPEDLIRAVLRAALAAQKEG